MPQEYHQAADLQCPQDAPDVTWFEIRPLTTSERRAAGAMLPDYPAEDSERMRTAWVLELQRAYLAFGLVSVDAEGWPESKTARFLGHAHWAFDVLDLIPEATQVWLGNAVYQLSHPK